ncbi:hypothetical protein M408DRAFT_327508 [Serendipita vermifera MAFF 305830]|uniref:Uncharacterized protein n=1 Tax=Serendipita vermifera MAFF 305830 TaxID=933852 RepID=A0A0C3BIC3_SERVB|nr:hypothetical protein M408DRAFT_327508 [Serendipita vermifera MAFF 305830]
MNSLGLNLGILLESEGYPGIGPSSQIVSLVADALNGEAARWMSDFLLIAIGKRKHQHVTAPSHPLVNHRAEEKRSPARAKVKENQDLVLQRDGDRCCISGSIHSVAGAQLIPFSDDPYRIDRFRILARVFFQAEVPSLSDVQLQSTENALRLSMYWKDRLDRGRLVFLCIDGDFHAIPVSRDDSDTLAEERRSNGLKGPTILDIHGNTPCCTHPRLSPQLAWVHRVITKTWLETGLADRLNHEMDWVDSLPKHRQSVSALGQHGFSGLLMHRLMLM